MRSLPAALLLLTACGADDTKVLSGLDGAWSGTFETEQGSIPMEAEFEWKAEDELLFGLVTVTLPGAAAPVTYAVRRWDTVDDEVFLDLTDELDATHGMDLDGPVVSKKKFSGDGSTSEPCPQGSCGYAGTFSLSPADPADPGTTPAE